MRWAIYTRVLRCGGIFSLSLTCGSQSPGRIRSGKFPRTREWSQRECWPQIDDCNLNFRRLWLNSAAVLYLVLSFAYRGITRLRTFGARARNFRHYCQFRSRRRIQAALATDRDLSGTRGRPQSGSRRFHLFRTLGIVSHPVRMDPARGSSMDRFRAGRLRLLSCGDAGPADCVQPSTNGATDEHPALTLARVPLPLPHCFLSPMAGHDCASGAAAVTMKQEATHARIRSR